MDLITQHEVLVCCGTGGVGKTTTAAAIALEGARRGRRAIVVTIDPAKRLANALGIDALSNSAHVIDPALWDPERSAPSSGQLSALMLDTKATFDEVVRRHAGDDDQATRILDNRFYRNVSAALGGTQEYMAMEKLHELHDGGAYELIVIDTPPTRHALDFLDAPSRMVRLLDNRVFRILTLPTRAGFRLANVALQTIVRTLARVAGTATIDDLIAFIRAFDGMEAGFRSRAASVEALLGAPSTGFVLVTSARRDALDEAEHFAQRLGERDLSVDAVIVNRLHPSFADVTAAAITDHIAALRELSAKHDDERAAAAARLGTLYENLSDLAAVARSERSHLALLEQRTGTTTIASVPLLRDDIHDLGGLSAMAGLLFHADQVGE